MSLSSYKNSSKTWLQTFAWEIKARFFYLCVALGSSLVVSYQNSEYLLYLFVMSADRKSINLYQTEKAKCNQILNKTNFSQNFSEKEISFTDENGSANVEKAFDKEFSAVLPQLSLRHPWREAESASTIIESPFYGLKKESLALLRNQGFEGKFNADFWECFMQNSDFSVNFIFTDVQEAFASHLLICVMFSIMVIFPYLIYVILSFFSPSLFSHQCKKSIVDFIMFFMFCCFFTIMLQKIIIPKLAEYLISFNIENKGFRVEASTKIYSYCTWAIEIYIIFSCFFISVYSIIYLSLNKLIKIDYLIEKQKWLRISLLLISTFLAPPDLGSTLAICFTSLLLLEICFYFLFIYNHLLKK